MAQNPTQLKDSILYHLQQGILPSHEVVARCSHLLTEAEFASIEKLRKHIAETQARKKFLGAAKEHARQLAPKPIPQNPIDKINSKGGNFQDFANLKSGRDQFTPYKLPKLETMVAAQDAQTARETFEDDATRAKVLRWVLRGLKIENAIHKVKVDLEITENAIAAAARNIVDDYDFTRGYDD